MTPRTTAPSLSPEEALARAVLRNFGGRYVDKISGGSMIRLFLGWCPGRDIVLASVLWMGRACRTY